MLGGGKNGLTISAKIAAQAPFSKDEHGIFKTALMRCFAVRDERGHQVARVVTEQGVSITPCETLPNAARLRDLPPQKCGRSFRNTAFR